MIKQFQPQGYVKSLHINKVKKKIEQYISIPNDSCHHDQFASSSLEKINILLSNRSKRRGEYFTINRKSEGKIKGHQMELVLSRFNSPQRNNEKGISKPYRVSLEEKYKISLTNLFEKQQSKIQQFNNKQREIDRKKSFFPLNNAKSYQRNQKTEQTIIRKKVYNWVSPYSVKNISQHSQKIQRKNQFQKCPLFNRNLIKKSIQLIELEKMRSERLNYKPIVRVKKMKTLNSIESLSSEDLQQSGFIINQWKFQPKQTNSEIKRRLKIKSESSELIEQGRLRFMYNHKRQRYLKAKQRLNHFEKIDEWQHEKNQFGQDF